MLKTSEIDNYPGAPSIRDVYSFADSMHTQAAAFGAEFKTEEVLSVRAEENIKIVSTSHGEYHTRTLILATGASPKNWGSPEKRSILVKVFHTVLPVTVPF